MGKQRDWHYDLYVAPNTHVDLNVGEESRDITTPLYAISSSNDNEAYDASYIAYWFEKIAEAKGISNIQGFKEILEENEMGTVNLSVPSWFTFGKLSKFPDSSGTSPYISAFVGVTMDTPSTEGDYTASFQIDYGGEYYFDVYVTIHVSWSYFNKTLGNALSPVMYHIKQYYYRDTDICMSQCLPVNQSLRFESTVWSYGTEYTITPESIVWGGSGLSINDGVLEGTLTETTVISLKFNGSSYNMKRYFLIFPSTVSSHTLTVTTSGADHFIGVSGSGTYYRGDSVQIKVYPNDFSRTHFTKWNDGDVNESRTITMPDWDCVYTAICEENSYKTVTLQTNNSEWGSVKLEAKITNASMYWEDRTSSGKIYGDETARITATPATKCSFLYWNSEGGSTDNPLLTTVTDNVTYKACFEYSAVTTVTIGCSRSDVTGTYVIVLDANTAYEREVTVTDASSHTYTDIRQSIQIIYTPDSTHYVDNITESITGAVSYGNTAVFTALQTTANITITTKNKSYSAWHNMFNVYCDIYDPDLDKYPTMYNHCCGDESDPWGTPLPYTYYDMFACANWQHYYDEGGTRYWYYQSAGGQERSGIYRPMFWTKEYPISISLDYLAFEQRFDYPAFSSDYRIRSVYIFNDDGETIYSESVPDSGYLQFNGLTLSSFKIVTGTYTGNDWDRVYLEIGTGSTTYCGERIMVIFAPLSSRYNNTVVDMQIYPRNGASYDTTYKCCYNDKIATKIEKPGMTFAGWFNSPTSTTRNGYDDATWQYVNGTNVIYAGWNGTVLHFDKRGGSGGTDTLGPLTYTNVLSSITPPTTIPQGTSGFQGYFTGKNGSGNKIFNADGSVNTSYNEGRNFWVDQTVILYAYYGEAQDITTIFVQKGISIVVTDSFGTSTIDATLGDKTVTKAYSPSSSNIIKLTYNTPSTGYTFLKWTLGSNQYTTQSIEVYEKADKTICCYTTAVEYTINYENAHINGNRKKFTVEDIPFVLADPEFPNHEFNGWLENGATFSGTISELREYNLKATWYNPTEITDIAIYKNSADVSNSHVFVGMNASIQLDAIPFPETAVNPTYEWKTYYKNSSGQYDEYTSSSEDYPLQLRTTSNSGKVYPYAVIDASMTEEHKSITDYKIKVTSGEGECEIYVTVTDNPLTGKYQRDYKDRCIIQVIGENEAGQLGIIRAVDLGTITSLNETIRIEKVSTATPSYSANATFVHDKGVTEQISLNFARKSHTWYKSTDDPVPAPSLDDDGMPVDNCKHFVYDESGNLIPDKEKFDDESQYDSVFWSNKYFAKVMRKIVNRWQVDTDGIKFLYIPRKCNGTNGMNYRVVGGGAWSEEDKDYQFIGVNAYIKSYSTEYTTDSTDVLKGDMTILVGGMNANYT